MEKYQIMNTFRSVIAKPANSYLEKWLSDGGKCIGYHCSLIPSEIFTAAGMMPYRIRGAGSTNTALTEVHVGSKWCSFVKHSLNLALEGEFDFLSGIVSMNSCESMRKAYKIWEVKTGIPFKAFISVPKVQDENMISWYRQELDRVIRAMEQHFSIKIGPEELAKAILLHNAVRRNLIKLNALRKRELPSISGEEALTIAVAAHVMPLKDFNPLIEQYLEKLTPHQGPHKYRVRLMVSGGEVDEPEFIKIIEDQGGLVVYDDYCFGARYYEELVSEAGDPLTEITRRYLFRVPCARFMGGFKPRYDNLQRAKKEYGADGIIFQRMAFCAPHSGLALDFSVQAKKDENSMPMLFMDREYLGSGTGQVRTRVQAFIERIESSRGEGRI